ncbi:hypothetical protein A2Y85_05115 [candidate division WOR-3 bacterium RBG_13_43_14]|uniref:Tetratricopeptide repeat protein n=1 Tax=candidate division WOR-3 bacterium RBG_13_43_14 TaxID=1802590 RepID=A0A1F4U8I2_UNCW3|nr:MAG: hypothetical protein A2Y85_05115 [candidate division WOR-3 bacterium RBG_13_43_14]
MKAAILVVLLAVMVIILAYDLDLKHDKHKFVNELMYFPSGNALHTISLGFYTLFADIVWLRFIQYYGEHRLTDVKYELMYHILDILTSLDAHFSYAYTLGGLMLTHDANDPARAKILLKKGMYANPDDWHYPFMYAFIHYTFLKEYRTAQVYFRISSLKPGAPDMAKRWAAFVAHLKIHDLETAMLLWTDLFNNTDNPQEKEIALNYIRRLRMEFDLKFLNEKVQEFYVLYGFMPNRIAELLEVGILDSIPPEPHGERYYIKKGRVYSTLERGKKKLDSQ